MEPVKVVVRYTTGKVIKGFAQDFFPNKDRFHLHPTSKTSADVMEILIKDLKAIFFVQDFEGDAQYHERKMYLEGEKTTGRKVEVTFADGEVLWGQPWAMIRTGRGSFSIRLIPRATT